MSYLSELLRGQASAKETLAKSVRYLRDKLGVTVSDKSVDATVKAADKLTDAVEVAVKAYLATTGLPLPAAILAAQASKQVFTHLDGAISAAGEVIKANN